MNKELQRFRFDVLRWGRPKIMGVYVFFVNGCLSILGTVEDSSKLKNYLNFLLGTPIIMFVYTKPMEVSSFLVICMFTITFAILSGRRVLLSKSSLFKKF